MGGHGGLNILPQKRWHVYRDDNRLRVLRDEREFQEALEAERQQQQRRVMSDVVTLLKRRKHGAIDATSANVEPSGSTSVPSNSALPTQQPPQQQPAVKRMRGAQRENVAQRGSIDVLRSVAPAPSSFVTNSPVEDQRLSTGQVAAHSAGGVSTHREDPGVATALPESSWSGSRGGGPVMALPLPVSSGLSDPLGRRRDGHFNFFADAEREAVKKQKKREMYLQQAGHSTSRQSEFAGIAKDLENVWYQAELPSNRLAREEREGGPPPAGAVNSVEAAAKEARRRMLALRQLRSASEKSSSFLAPTAKDSQQPSRYVELDSGSSDSDICIVEERHAGSTGCMNDREAKAKTSRTKSGSHKSRKGRKRLKRMKRKWMLAALELQAAVDGVSRKDGINGNEGTPIQRP